MIPMIVARIDFLGALFPDVVKPLYASVAVASAFDPEPGVDGIGDFIEFGGLEVLEGFEFHAGSLGVSRNCP